MQIANNSPTRLTVQKDRGGSPPNGLWFVIGS